MSKTVYPSANVEEIFVKFVNQTILSLKPISPLGLQTRDLDKIRVTLSVKVRSFITQKGTSNANRFI